jgi:hypothetical protein
VTSCAFSLDRAAIRPGGRPARATRKPSRWRRNSPRVRTRRSTASCRSPRSAMRPRCGFAPSGSTPPAPTGHSNSNCRRFIAPTTPARHSISCSRRSPAARSRCASSRSCSAGSSARCASPSASPRCASAKKAAACRRPRWRVRACILLLIRARTPRARTRRPRRETASILLLIPTRAQMKSPPPLTPPRHSLREWGEGNLETCASPHSRAAKKYQANFRLMPPSTMSSRPVT